MSTETPDQSRPTDPGQPRDPATQPGATPVQDPDAQPGVVPQPNTDPDHDAPDDTAPGSTD